MKSFKEKISALLVPLGLSLLFCKLIKEKFQSRKYRNPRKSNGNSQQV